MATFHELISIIDRQRLLTALANNVAVQSASGGQSTIQFQDEGVNLGATGTVDTLDFTGTGVAASRVGNVVTVNVAGGSGSGDVVGPAGGVVEGEGVEFDQTTGKLIQGSGVVTSAFMKTVLDDATAAAARVTMGGLPFCLYKNNTPAALTASTAETVMDQNLLIGAATLGPTDSLRISIVATKVGANGTLTIRLRCGTLGTTGDLQIATFTTAAGNLYIPFKREITFESLTAQFMYPTTAAVLQDNIAVNNSGFTLTIDFNTLANYLMPTFQLSSGADAVTMRHFEVEVIRNS